MNDIKSVTDISEKSFNKIESIFSWINQPKEEAREFLIDLAKKNDNITTQETATLIYKSRKFAREYANSKIIYEQAKMHFDISKDEKEIDDDWLHFFFDKAEKVSNKSMQYIWSKLLAGEFNKPGSISRKLMHIISVMDATSASSFQTFCLYIFEQKGLIASYNTVTVMIPSGFYEDSFGFMRNVEVWLHEAGYPNYKELAISLTMSQGELNALENLGLIQKVRNGKCGITLIYELEDETIAYLVPDIDTEFPLGQYALTSEGEQLYNIINNTGKEAVLKIIEKYLTSLGKKFKIEKYYGRFI